MLNIGKESEAKAKCYFTHTLLPQYIDDKQPPTKRKPFSQIYAQPFSHTLELIVPEAKAAKIQHAIEGATNPLQYCKVHLKLLDILTGDFFNEYIKTGNILLLSAGSSTLSSPHISIQSGILTISLSKPLYERVGLPGVAVPSPARKHTKSRFRITQNLRLPSMVKGKRGFERLLWAAENVLTDTLTWLFVDLRAEAEDGRSQGTGPIEKFAPFVRRVECEVSVIKDVLVPRFELLGGTVGEEKREEVLEVLEWIALVCAGSERVRKGDAIDGFLSRYEVPRLGMEHAENEEVPKAMDLVRLRWHGFMSAGWVARVFTAALKAAGNGGGEDDGDWFAMKVCGFEDRSLVVLKQAGTALTWDCE